ncbi:Type 4 prepilin-like proteins leader peptide-processing enzyme [Gossypium arboreum]|uniref:Type 4 prepilin-like proteins leader peptide-processing enzyme n=1 Tax=Gossypium arboreum TaxID=29729 RepID=A0A0B0PVF6_GOSAR|nr:Type 4 prepilin-like proteins leader peptide-processing enzyme [Gossypium arboreum]
MPTSQTWSYMYHISMPLSQIGSYTNQIRRRCPRYGLTHNYIYRCQCPKCGLTREHISEILCHDICILAIPKVHTWLSDIVTRSNRTRKHSSQVYTHSTIIYTSS